VLVQVGDGNGLAGADRVEARAAAVAVLGLFELDGGGVDALRPICLQSNMDTTGHGVAIAPARCARMGLKREAVSSVFISFVSWRPGSASEADASAFTAARCSAA
jgi:hypothetical protein